MAARRSGVDELAPFVLTNMEGLKKDSEEAGHGAYGVIYNVTVNGLPYVAKRLHKALVDKVRNSEDIKKRFRSECITLSRLKHPNVVHFIGVHYGRERSDLTLIMECLYYDLSSFLETRPPVPLPLKLSILLDVTYGLLYLHTHDPPIVHRDLTDRNILLTTDRRAKLADLGMAKLLTPQAMMAVNKHTTAPGRLLYMPPETLTENPECTPKIDIFSFGHLSLFTINQEDPEVILELTNVPKATELQGGIQALKRRHALEKVGHGHCMHSLIIRCLHDKPTQRPDTVELTKKVQELCTKYPKTVEDVVTLDEKYTQQIETLTQKLEDVARERETLRGTLKETESKYQVQISALHNQTDSLREQVANLEGERNSLLQQLRSVKAERDDLKTKKDQLEKENLMPQSAANTAQREDDNELEEDDDTALAQALRENNVFHKKQTSNLRKIADLEKQLKKKDAELQAMKQQVSFAPQNPPPVVCEPKIKIVDSDIVKEKDQTIRYLRRKLDNVTHLEDQLTQLTIELTRKDEELSRLKKGGIERSQVQEHTAQQHIQELSAELEKMHEHSRNQSWEVLKLKQEADGLKIQATERNQFMEGLLENTERERNSLLQQLRSVKAERDDLKTKKDQLEKENFIMKQQEMKAMQTSRLLEAQMDEATCPMRGCRESRKEYSKLVAKNAQLQKSLASVGRISEQVSASEVKLCEQNRIVADLREQVTTAQIQAASNKADFEEERSDRMKAHSKFADLETQAAETKSQFEQERATYKQRIASFQQDLSAVKIQLKTHVQELAHFKVYCKRKEDQVKELTEDKFKLKNELAKMKAKAESMIKQYRKENEQLKAQLSQAATSMVSMSEEMKGKKGKKKISEDFSKAIKKFKKAVSTKPTERSGEPMECELTEAQGVIDMQCKAIDEKEEELRQLRVANREMSKTLTAGPKAMKKYSYNQSQTNTEDDQPNSLSEDSEALFFLPDTYNEGRSHTAGTGHMATVPKQASVTASTDFPSTFATQDQLSPLPPSGTHSSTGGTFYEGDYRRGSVSTMGITIMASSPSYAYSQSSSSAVSMKNKQLPLRARETQPPILRFHSNPGPQQSSSREPVRAVAPTPSTTNQNDPCPQQPSTKQPLRALAPPPSVTNQSVPGFQPFPVRIRQTDGTVPQQQQIVDNLQPWIRYPPKMHSEKQQRELETKQNVNPWPVRSQPQPQQMQQQQSNVQAHSNQQQLGQPHHQMRNVQPHGGYPQGTVQQLQPPQGRPYSDHQQYTAESDATHQPESHTPHSHPLAGKHSGGMPAAKPRTNVPGGGPSQAEYQQPLPPQEAQNRKDHILSHAAPEYKQSSHMSGQTLNTLSKQASHDNQPAGSVPSNAHQTVARNASQQPSPSQAANYVNFRVLQQNQPPQSAGLSQYQQNFESQASSTSTTAAPNAQQSHGPRKVPQGERQKRMISELPPLESLMADQHSNKLSTIINDDIGDVAAKVREQVSGSRERTVTNTERPFDPNLVCPMCQRRFRIGEIQKFRRHVNSCGS